MALKGDTIRFEVQFKDYDGYQVEPINVKLNVYDGDEVAIDSIPLSEVNKLSTGKYFYDYTIPYKIDELIYEFYGEYYSRPIISRQRIDVRFVY